MPTSNDSAMIVGPQEPSAASRRSGAKLAEVVYRNRVSARFKKLSDLLQRIPKEPRRHKGLFGEHSRPQILDLACDGIEAMIAEVNVLKKHNEDLIAENTALKQSLRLQGQANSQAENHSTPNPAAEWNSAVISPPLAVPSTVDTFQQGIALFSFDTQHWGAAGNSLATNMGSPPHPHNDLTAFPTQLSFSPTLSGTTERQQVWNNSDFQAYYQPPSGQSEYFDHSAF